MKYSDGRQVSDESDETFSVVKGYSFFVWKPAFGYTSFSVWAKPPYSFYIRSSLCLLQGLALLGGLEIGVIVLFDRDKSYPGERVGEVTSHLDGDLQAANAVAYNQARFT